MSRHSPLLSMTRRVALTVLGSFVAVFVVLYVWLWQQSLARDTGEVDRGLLHSAQGMVAALDAVDTPDAARALLALVRVQSQDADGAAVPPLSVALSRLDGSAAEQLGAFQGLDRPALLALAEGISSPPASGRAQGQAPAWRLYTATGQRWKVTLADETPARSRSVGWSLFTDLALYLALALPIVGLPVWLLARATLKPLRQLSDTVAARSPLDTRPLPPRRGWKELAPLETALNQLFQRTAQGLAREKTFVHDAAHELRTPLAVIATQAHVLAHSQGSDREQAHLHLQAAVQRASHLTQQLLRLAQAEAADAGRHQPVDLMDLVRDTLALQADRAAAQATELELQGPDQLPLQSDPRALRSILDNLVDNALRYGGPGGVVAVTVAVEASGHRAVLRVADAGPGIPAADAEQVFERFWRGSGHTEAGTGLGLAIARGAARALGGDVRLRPGGPGACFELSLPRA